MGIITKAFERELGKNAGKVLSNMVFGDKHSTPYRRVHKAPPPPPRLSKAQLDHEANLVRIEAEKVLQSRIHRDQQKQHKSELELQERIFEEQQQKEHQEYLQKYIIELQSALKDALDINTDNPSLEQLNYLLSILETKIWSSKIDIGTKSLEKNKNRLENELADIFLLKFKECLDSISDNVLSKIKRKY